MSQSPEEADAKVGAEHPYAEATSQLNQLVRQGRAFSGHERNCCYLNTRDGRFANASAVSGFDFAEDGRCVVRCDWDFDGDLDLWVSNRTGPRLRFLRNNVAEQGDFVAFRLVGTTSNRDAIGATVHLKVGKHQQQTVLIQGLRRGEGFLGQSSSWVHFGLGADPFIQGLEVRWPTGVVEPFPLPEPGGYYELVEGSGETVSWRPPIQSQAKQGKQPLTNPQLDANAHHLLSQAMPLPPLRYKTFAGRSGDATASGEGPILLNLWASWCRPCLVELKEWSSHKQDLEDLGLRVIALSVDGMEKPEQRDVTKPRELLERLGFTLDAGMASAEIVELMQLVNNLIYQHDHRPLPVPTSFLIDREGRLAAVYKGPVSLDRLAQDIEALPLSDEDRLSASLPFSGRWIGLQGPARMRKLAAAMWEAGYRAETMELATRLTDPVYESLQVKLLLDNSIRLRENAQDLPKAVEQLQAVLQIDPQNPDALMELGVLAAKQGDLAKAIELLQQAVRHADPPNSDAHFNLGKALRLAGRSAEAKQTLVRSIEINPNQSQAYEMLGHLFVVEKDFEKAAKLFAKAWANDSSNKNHLINLVTALIQLGQPAKAYEALQAALQSDPADIALRVYLAQVLLQMNKTDQAVAELELVVQQQPNASKVWYQLAQLAQQRGQWKKAASHLKQLVQLAPSDPIIKADLAWILATAPEDSVRNGALATRLAENAAQATKRQNWRVLDVLAATYAEQGKFEQASRTQVEAIQLLTAGNPRQLDELKGRRQLYLDKKPYRLGPRR